MKLADQDTALPSNKVIAMSAVTIAFHYGSGNVLPPEILEAWGVLIQVGLALGAAWFTPDRPNVPRVAP